MTEPQRKGCPYCAGDVTYAEDGGRVLFGHTLPVCTGFKDALRNSGVAFAVEMVVVQRKPGGRDGN